jgi:cAMP-dependent protein kinase regulator
MLTARGELKRRVDALRNIPLLAGCTTKQLERVDRLGTQIDVAAGRMLTRHGAEGHECFVVVDGIATASRGEAVLGLVGPGSIAGEMALLYDAPRTATVVARTPMRLLVLNGDEFKELLGVARCIRRDVDRIAAERSSHARQIGSSALHGSAAEVQCVIFSS